MLDFSVFPMAFRTGAQNCTSTIHNLSYMVPIFKWDTSMNLWLNSLIFYIKILLFNEGQNFNPFSYLIFS